MPIDLQPNHLNDLIPLSARTILNVGEGTAAWWGSYQAMNPRAGLIGMGADCDQDSEIDCIVCDGATAATLTLLQRHVPRLAPDGSVVLRIVNLDYWRIIEAALRGSARMAGEARTGLSPRVVTAELERLGLTICDTIPLDAANGDAATFLQAMTPSLQALGIDPAEFAARSAAPSVVIRATRDARRGLNVLGTMLNPVGGVSDVRVVLPLRALATDPATTTRISFVADNDHSADGSARIFVLHRPAMMGPSGHDMLNTLAASGYVIVTEFDDLPDIFEMMRHGGDLNFYGVHAIQTSTVALAERMRDYCPEIAVFPNAITELPDIANFRDLNRLTLFFGALNRERDWQPLMPVLNEIAALAGDRLRFEVVHDSQFFQALDTPHKRFTPTCDYPTYQALLSQSEISFMPLLDTRFSRAKSDLKFIEAASCRAVALASHVVYGNSVEDGRTGMLFRDPVELRRALLRLVALPSIARQLADAARQYVIDERMLAYQVAPRAAWYRSLWERREELESARRQRIASRG